MEQRNVKNSKFYVVNKTLIQVEGVCFAYVSFLFFLQ